MRLDHLCDTHGMRNEMHRSNEGLQTALRCTWVCYDQAEFPRNPSKKAPPGNIAALLYSRCATRRNNKHSFQPTGTHKP